MSKRILTAALLGLAVAGSAGAVTVRLLDGGTANVELSQIVVLPGATSSPDAQSAPAGLRYTVIEPNSGAWTGVVPGTDMVGVSDPALAQNPATGDLFVVFSRPDQGFKHLAFSTWTGQAWTDPLPLTSGRANDTQPVLTFRPGGDAVLAWRHAQFLPTILVKNFNLGIVGAGTQLSFVDVGNPAALLSSAGGPVGLKSGLGAVLTDPLFPSAYVFLADPDHQSMALLRLDLNILNQGGGFGAAPVPVTFSRVQSSSVTDPNGVGAATEVPGQILTPFRMTVADAVVYYWFDDTTVDLVVFRNGEAGRVITFARPAAEEAIHLQAYMAARRELGRLDGLRPVGGERSSGLLGRRGR